MSDDGYKVEWRVPLRRRRQIAAAQAEGMSVEELKATAEDIAVAVPTGAKKADLVAAIQNAGRNHFPTTETPET